MLWTVVVLAVVIATMIVAIGTDSPTALQDDETTWP